MESEYQMDFEEEKLYKIELKMIERIKKILGYDVKPRKIRLVSDLGYWGTAGLELNIDMEHGKIRNGRIRDDTKNTIMHELIHYIPMDNPAVACPCRDQHCNHYRALAKKMRLKGHYGQIKSRTVYKYICPYCKSDYFHSNILHKPSKEWYCNNCHKPYMVKGTNKRKPKFIWYYEKIVTVKRKKLLLTNC